ncbi:MAG: hypothetical protein J7480_00040 [Microbacteriaceae bacterium]|nr:hypothetical protein [Microbacteriaceae bacterium]
MPARAPKRDPELDLLASVIRMRPHRRRELGELLLDLRLREIDAPGDTELSLLQHAIDDAIRQGDGHRPWYLPINEIFGPEREPERDRFGQIIPPDPGEPEPGYQYVRGYDRCDDDGPDGTAS